MEAAVEDINKAGGVFVKEYGCKLPIELIIANCESNPVKVGTLAEDMAARDKVHAFAGPIIPPPINAPMAIVAERYKIPFTAGNPTVGHRPRRLHLSRRGRLLRRKPSWA